MRGHLVTIAALAVIAACALIVFIRIESAYRAPDGPALPASWTPGPLVPSSPTASPAATTPAAPASPRPGHTVTTWTTVTPKSASTGEDGP